MRNIVFLMAFITYQVGFSQERPVGTIGFYNLENLFDTEDDPEIRDEEYLPEGDNQWDKTKYQSKLTNMSRVISDMANGPDILGVCEVENRKVLEDLAQTTKLERKRYQIIHFDSPDGRGIDVALLYKQGIFVPFDTRSIRVKDPSNEDWNTRDILWVKGLYQKDTLHVAVNHWPSRRSGDEKRVLAASYLRKAVDSVLNINPEAKIVLMGDFNDDPSNRSIKKTLMADSKEKKLTPKMLFNTSGDTFKKGFGTLYYRGAWNLFDQIIISQSMMKQNSDSFYYIPMSFRVFATDYMRQTEGEYKGAPHRTYVRGVYKNGYSDHFPSLIFIGKN